MNRYIRFLIVVIIIICIYTIGIILLFCHEKTNERFIFIRNQATNTDYSAVYNAQENYIYGFAMPDELTLVDQQTKTYATVGQVKDDSDLYRTYLQATFGVEYAGAIVVNNQQLEQVYGNIDATLGPKGQVPGEKILPDVSTMLVIEQIAPQSKKGPKIVVSRTSSKIVEKVMEVNIPELEKQIISIEAIAREAGDRSKVALKINDESTDLDLIGSCVGPKGNRINKIRKELHGENIDLIEYFDDPIIYISNALAPALVTAVQIIDEENKLSRVIVPNDQLSLAIGASGQNVRLASRLTGWKIDIKSEQNAQEERINYEDDII